MLFTERPVAVVFDWDKTLSPHYMQSPIFKEYGVEEKHFWEMNHAHTAAHSEISGLKCFKEHEYLNAILACARDRTFKGLDNAKLRELGTRIELYPGVVNLFYRLKSLGAEIYIVTSGIREMIKNLPFIKGTVTEIYGSDFADYRLDKQGQKIPYVPTADKPSAIQSVIRVVTPSDKIRILNEISKGALQGKFDACLRIREEDRRIPFKHMIYVGDGISDIYAFDTVRSGGGYTVGVYNPEEHEFDQIEMIRQDGWLDILGVADFRPETTVCTWLTTKVKRLQYSIDKEQQAAHEVELEEVRLHVPKFNKVK